MRKSSFWIIAVVLFLGATVAATGFTTASAGRADCPDTIICPITGEEVCKDRCPLMDPTRSDCPGKIVCPISGELVCRDECPLGAVGTTASDPQACCQGKK